MVSPPSARISASASEAQGVGELGVLERDPEHRLAEQHAHQQVDQQAGQARPGREPDRQDRQEGDRRPRPARTCRAGGRRRSRSPQAGAAGLGPRCYRASRRSGSRPRGTMQVMSRYAVAARANVPPFHVMDLLAAADAAAAHPRRPGQPGGRAADDRGPAAGPRRGDPAARLRRPAGLHRRRPGSPSCARRSPGTTGARHGIDVAPTTWWSRPAPPAAFLLAFLAAFEVGDRVAMARPGYPCYRNVLTALGCEVVEIPTGPETRFQPTVEQVAALERPSPGLVVASPANPTGTMLLPEELAALARWCEDARGPADLRRDLPRHRVRPARRPRRRWPAARGRPPARRSSSARSPSTSR